MVNKVWQEAERFLSTNDPLLGEIIAKYGSCTLIPERNYYYNLCKSIISQQISTKVATTISRRFADLFGEKEIIPHEFLKLTDEELRNVGLSKQKISYLRDLSAKILKGELAITDFDQLTNSQIEKQLLKVKGVGPWTVTMFLIFGLNRTDVLPTGDLGIKKAIQNVYKFQELPTPEEMEELAKMWHPFETLASWYLWRSLDNKE